MLVVVVAIAVLLLSLLASLTYLVEPLPSDPERVVDDTTVIVGEVEWKDRSGTLERPVVVEDGGRLRLVDCDIQVMLEDMVLSGIDWFRVEDGGVLEMEGSTVNIVHSWDPYSTYHFDVRVEQGEFFTYDPPSLHRVVNLRDYTRDRHRTADDRPYGGGSGMVLKPEPLFEAVGDLRAGASRVILLSPRGTMFDQETALRLSRLEHLILIAGRYEGVDERVSEHLVDEEISIGDYVLSGGEVPAMVLVEGLVRLLPGVLGNPESLDRESFSGGDLLEGPHYTRPPVYRGLPVPEVLRSGHHAEIERWRRERALARTRERRPDLLDRTEGSTPDPAEAEPE